LEVEQLPVLDVPSCVVPTVPPITIEEIGQSVVRLPSRKAPGPDLVPNEMIKLAFKRHPEVFRECYNACLTNGVFPKSWKCAKLVLLHKGKGKARDLPSSYRPISLLDGLGSLGKGASQPTAESHHQGRCD